MPNRKADESSLWHWLKPVQTYYGQVLHMERIENSAGKGTPDIEGCLSGVSFTIEDKSIARPKRPTTPLDIGISAEQEWWALRREAARGHHHYFLIQVGSGNEASRYLIRGGWVKTLRARITESELSDISFQVYRPLNVMEHIYAPKTA